MKKILWNPKVRVPIVLTTWLALALIGWTVVYVVVLAFLADFGK